MPRPAQLCETLQLSIQPLAVFACEVCVSLKGPGFDDLPEIRVFVLAKARKIDAPRQNVGFASFCDTLRVGDEVNPVGKPLGITLGGM